MKNTMNRILGYLVGENLDLSYFFNLSINDDNKIRLLGFYTPEAENYLYSKGFKKIDYLYADNDEIFEFGLENICATLSIESSDTNK